jgi:hypothetical protein
LLLHNINGRAINQCDVQSATKSAHNKNSLEGRLEIGQRLEALGRQAQPLARIVDQAPRDSSRWAEAAKELCAITAECLRLARSSGDETLIEEAQRTAALLEDVIIGKTGN